MFVFNIINIYNNDKYLIFYFLKVSLQKSKITLSKTANAFEIMIGNSSFFKPYQTQRLSPEIKITSINAERSSVFLVLKTFITCGTDAMLVSAPAIKPSVFSSITETFYHNKLNLHGAA